MDCKAFLTIATAGAALDLDAEHSVLNFIGYEFRKVRDRLFGTGKRYLHFGPSAKSVKRVCHEAH